RGRSREGRCTAPARYAAALMTNGLKALRETFLVDEAVTRTSLGSAAMRLPSRPGEGGAERYLPATVSLSTSTEPVRIEPRVSTSEPIARIERNMSLRLPATVTSFTGYAILPRSTQKPAAPRE